MQIGAGKVEIVGPPLCGIIRLHPLGLRRDNVRAHARMTGDGLGGKLLPGAMPN